MGFSFEVKRMLKRSSWVYVYAGIITKRAVIGGFQVITAKLKQNKEPISKTLMVATLTLITLGRKDDMPKLDCNSDTYFLNQHKYYYLLFKENLLIYHATTLLSLSAKLKSV